jgi:hypothetical protein
MTTVSSIMLRLEIRLCKAAQSTYSRLIFLCILLNIQNIQNVWNTKVAEHILAYYEPYLRKLKVEYSTRMNEMK